MNAEEIYEYIMGALSGASAVEQDGCFFFFDEPGKKFPFATLVTTDAHDTASNLSRDGVFRLNLGLSRESFRALFPSAEGGPAGGESGAWDFTALDHLMPHPVYGGLHWVCVLNPGVATFEKVKPLLAEAFKKAGGKTEE